ncbi:MAG: hypothetical protein ACI9Y7_002886 [Dokdonia sp.]
MFYSTFRGSARRFRKPYINRVGNIKYIFNMLKQIQSISSIKHLTSHQQKNVLGGNPSGDLYICEDCEDGIQECENQKNGDIDYLPCAIGGEQ